MFIERPDYVRPCARARWACQPGSPASRAAAMEMQSLDVKLDAGAGAGAGLLDSTSKDSAPLEWDGLTFSINGKTLLQDVSGGIKG